ncbi:MAG: hypothetical protein ABR503_16985, partial [Chitinophagaceae bacterium]
HDDTTAVKFRVGDLKQLIQEHNLLDSDVLSFKFASYTEEDYDRYEKKGWIKNKLKKKEFGNRTTLVINFWSRKEKSGNEAIARSSSLRLCSYDLGDICPPPEGMCDPQDDDNQ